MEPGSALLFHSWPKNVRRRSWRNWEKGLCVFFRINLLSRSSNRFKDERLLIIPLFPPLFFLVNLTFLSSLILL